MSAPLDLDWFTLMIMGLAQACHPDPVMGATMIERLLNPAIDQPGSTPRTAVDMQRYGAR